MKSTLLFWLSAAAGLLLFALLGSAGQNVRVQQAMFLGMWIAFEGAFFSAKSIEDADPKRLTLYLILLSVAAAAIALLRPMLFFGGWLVEPLSLSNILHPLSGLSADAHRVIGSIAFVMTSVVTLATLRTLERRPRFLLGFLFNPLTLLLLGGMSTIFVVLLAFALASWMLVQGRWSLALAGVGLAFGFGWLGIACAALFLRHASPHIAKAERMKRLAFALTIYFVISAAVTMPYNAEMLVTLLFAPWMGAIGVTPIFFTLALVLSAAFILFAELSGRDTALFAALIVITLLVISIFAISIAPIVLLLLAAVPFRSLPQSILALILGVMSFAPESRATDWPMLAAIAIFLILFVLQSRHAWKETGLFKTIELT